MDSGVQQQYSTVFQNVIIVLFSSQFLCSKRFGRNHMLTKLTNNQKCHIAENYKVQKIIYSSSLIWLWSILKNKFHMGITPIGLQYFHKMGMYRSTKNLNIKKVFSYLLVFQQIIMKKLSIFFILIFKQLFGSLEMITIGQISIIRQHQRIGNNPQGFAAELL